MSGRNPASRIFYYFEREEDGAPFAFDAADGPTVPIFSSAALARGALPVAHGVTPISPTQMTAFAQLCLAAGAKFLELDPQAKALGGAQARWLAAS